MGFFARLFGRRRKVEPVVEVEPVAAEPEPGRSPRARARSSREPEPVAAEPEPEPVAAEPEPEPVAAEPEPEPVGRAAAAPLDAERAEAILTGVLDDLGSAHHRPFSRG